MLKIISLSLVILTSSICYGGDFIVLPNKTIINKNSIRTVYINKYQKYGEDQEDIQISFNGSISVLTLDISYYDFLYQELINPTVEIHEPKLGPNQSQVIIQDMIKEVSSWNNTSFPWETEEDLLRTRKSYLINNLQRLQ